MGKQLTYKLMNPGEEEKVINIVSTVFNEFVAPQYSEEGVKEFYKYANKLALNILNFLLFGIIIVDWYYIK